MTSLSSPEAEYYSICGAGAELIYASGLIRFAGYEVEPFIESDASSAISMAQRQGIGGVRHMEARYLWVQEKVEEGELKVNKIKGEENPADLCTKNLPSKKVNNFMKMMSFNYRDGRAEKSLELPALREEEKMERKKTR